MQGPHLLAPTGSDLGRHGEEGTVFAGYHYDINFLTIHYKSKFPGLSIWLRNGEKVEVKVPDGCLLIQAGKQVTKLTISSDFQLPYCCFNFTLRFASFDQIFWFIVVISLS